MSFGLHHHKLDRNPLAHVGKSEKFAEAGWWGWTFAGNSGFEYRAILTFCEQYGPDAWVSSPGRFSESIDLTSLSPNLDHFDFMNSEFSIWTKSEEIMREIIAYVETLPKRTAEIIVVSPVQMKKASAVFKGKNYRAVSLMRDYALSDEYIWAISIEGTVDEAEAMLAVSSETGPS